jgi:hypothetical protein
MTRNHYENAAIRAQRIMLVSLVVVAGPLLYGLVCLMESFDAAVRSYGETIRSRFGEVIGGAIGGASVAAVLSIPLLLWVGVMIAFDRRFGIRCPYCHRSLTARCLPGRVLESGECSFCHAKVFDEIDVP